MAAEAWMYPAEWNLVGYHADFKPNSWGFSPHLHGTSEKLLYNFDSMESSMCKLVWLLTFPIAGLECKFLSFTVRYLFASHLMMYPKLAWNSHYVTGCLELSSLPASVSLVLEGASTLKEFFS